MGERLASTHEPRHAEATARDSDDVALDLVGGHEARRAGLGRRLLALLPGVRREPDPHERLERSEETRRVVAALERLPAHRRAALLLREQEGLTYDEIAGVLGVSLAKVKVDIFRARTALKGDLGEPGETRASRRAP